MIENLHQYLKRTNQKHLSYTYNGLTTEGLFDPRELTLDDMYTINAYLKARKTSLKLAKEGGFNTNAGNS